MAHRSDPQHGSDDESCRSLAVSCGPYFFFKADSGTAGVVCRMPRACIFGGKVGLIVCEESGWRKRQRDRHLSEVS